MSPARPHSIRNRLTSWFAAQAVAAGVISQADADILTAQRDLVARVVRVDDFGQDLGASLLIPVQQDAAAQHARATSAPEVRRAVA